MVLNTDTREKNGKLVNKDKISDDDEPSNQTKKNLSKPKAGKSEYEEKIRVGKDYQVPIPSLEKCLEEPYDDHALLVWSPASGDDSKIEEYITLAREKYGYNVEQALGMLFWHKYDLEKAALDLANFTPLRDHWSKEDRILFEQAFQFHGKCFHRIRQMLPDKSIADLVKFYYCWKKTRNRSSVMDRQEERRKEGLPGNGSEHDGSLDDSEIEDKKWPIRGIRRTSRSPNRIQSPMLNIADSNAYNNPPTSSATNSTKLRAQRFGNKQGNENKDTGYSSSSSSSNGASKVSTSLNCQNCTVLCNELKNTSSGNFCASCYNHWRRTGMMRPTQGPYNMGIEVNQRPRSKTNKLYYYQGYHDGSIKYKRKPPKGMWINHDDVRKLAAQDANANETSKGTESNDLLKEVETEIEILLCHIQTNKQKISKLKKINEQFPDNRLPEESSLIRANSRWMKDEVALARLGFVKYGNNPKAIAEMIGTKTESHVKKKLKESIFQDLHASMKPNHDLKIDNNNEIMEIDSDDEPTMARIERNIGENQSDDNGKKKIDNLVEVTITPIRKSSKDVSVDSTA